MEVVERDNPAKNPFAAEIILVLAREDGARLCGSY
jgi:hypothetical protein